MELIGYAIEEIVIAFQGGDWGYGALAELVGDGLAYHIVNFFAMIGGH